MEQELLCVEEFFDILARWDADHTHGLALLHHIQRSLANLLSPLTTLGDAAVASIKQAGIAPDEVLHQLAAVPSSIPHQLSTALAALANLNITSYKQSLQQLCTNIQHTTSTTSCDALVCELALYIMCAVDALQLEVELKHRILSAVGMDTPLEHLQAYIMFWKMQPYRQPSVEAQVLTMRNSLLTMKQKGGGDGGGL